jgi:predicted RNase H-like nuclease
MSRCVQRIAGIDGCRSGWLVVEACPDLRDANFRIAPNWNAIASDAQVIAVDMPIGLSRDGVRQCEVAARKIISPHGSRVFKTLPRGTLKFAQKDWRFANQWAKARGFGGISKQIWAIRPKIIEIDRAIAPGMQRRIHEAHPELAFARLNKGRPLESKHTAEGLAARKHLLQRAGFTKLDDWLQRLRGSGAKADDLLDSCVLVLTARNLLQRRAKFVPPIPETDSRGLRMAIAY